MGLSIQASIMACLIWSVSFPGLCGSATAKGDIIWRRKLIVKPQNLKTQGQVEYLEIASLNVTGNWQLLFKDKAPV